MNKILIILILSIAACGLGAQIGGYVETNGVEIYYESNGEGNFLPMSYGSHFLVKCGSLGSKIFRRAID